MPYRHTAGGHGYGFAIRHAFRWQADSSVTPETLGQWALDNGHRTAHRGAVHVFVGEVTSLYGLSVHECSDEEGSCKMQEGHY